MAFCAGVAIWVKLMPLEDRSSLNPCSSMETSCQDRWMVVDEGLLAVWSSSNLIPLRRITIWHKRSSQLNQRAISEASEIEARGRYLDRWSRRDGRWAIDHRQFVQDLQRTHDADPMKPDEGQSRRDRSDPSYNIPS